MKQVKKHKLKKKKRLSPPTQLGHTKHKMKSKLKKNAISSIFLTQVKGQSCF